MTKVPKHIGIVPDGCRRFARRLMLKPWKGHEWGAKKVEALFDWCKELGIKEVTLYAFSIENFGRPKREFNYLMKLFEKEFKHMIDDSRIYQDKVRINFIGRINMFPENLQVIMKELQQRTKSHSNYIVNFAMAYGGRAEVIDAVKKLASRIKSNSLSIEEINEQVFSENLYIDREPDLIIRTSGEQRTSGFMLYQGAYAEWFFCKKMWPEFTKQDLILAINDYKSRERRFGR